MSTVTVVRHKVYRYRKEDENGGGFDPDLCRRIVARS